MQHISMHQFLASVSGSVSLEVFKSLGLEEMIQQALDEGGGREKKKCIIASDMIVVLVLMMNLSRTQSIVDVFRFMLMWLRERRPDLSLDVVTDEAIYHARQRVGAAALQVLFQKTAALCERRCNFHGHCTIAVDGVHFLVPDTKKNSDYFSRPVSNKDKAAFPQMKGVALVATETHEVIASEFGPYEMGENPVAEQLVEKHLRAFDLLIMDRGLPSVVLFKKVNSVGAKFLARISSAWKPKELKKLGPGDSLVQIKTRIPITSRRQRRQRNQLCEVVYMTVRMIEYTFESTGELIRIVTDFLDPDEVSALELANLYHERWEIEIVYDELKTHLESIPHGTAPTVFRSHTPEGILQEAYGMLAIYNLVRHLMAKAARRIRVPADQISFVRTLNVIRMSIPRFNHATEDATAWLDRQLLKDIAACKIDRPRRPRRYPRVVKIKFIRFPKKRPEHGEQYFDFVEELRVGMPPQERKAA